MPKKNCGLKLFTKTWPAKFDKKEKIEIERPLTATLEKPSILNIKLITKIDMSTMRKEFLTITNLYGLPLTIKTKRKKVLLPKRPCSLPCPDVVPPENKKEQHNSEDSWEDEESVRSAGKSKVLKRNLKLKNIVAPNKVIVKNKISDANNNKPLKLERNRICKALEVKKVLTKSSIKLPEPCKTCGRTDQPERFHSHPVTPPKSTKKVEITVKIPMKNSVQKPIAIKYKSKKSSTASTGNKPIHIPIPSVRKPSLPSQKLLHTPPTTAQPANENASSGRPFSSKRTLTCYICGREFGTASLSLHEPRCLEKWERGNTELPTRFQKSLPVKPSFNASSHDWNTLVFDAAQSKLVPCINCGRTFYPDRLIIHERCCKEVSTQNVKSTVESVMDKDNLSSSPGKPPTVQCFLCKKMFGNHSIKIHEKQCLKKWHIENEALPLSMRSKLPERKGSGISPQPMTSEKEKSAVPSLGSIESRPSTGKKPPLFPCYLCGKLFSVNSIYIHEPQCLKMWKIENEKLPSNKRRKEPLKPDIKFTRDGKIDFKATQEDNWKSHLNQLVPCKMCSRTFNPERVEIHEKSCKGL